MSLVFDIIEKKLLLSIIRWICLALCVVIIYLDSVYSNIYFKILLGLSIGTYIVLTLGFSLFIKRFKTIGQFRFNETDIVILKDNIERLDFRIDKNIKISITLTGFRGENLQYFYFVISEGIGLIEIEYNDEIYRYDIIVDKEFRKRLTDIIVSYKDLGANIKWIKKKY